MDTNHQSRLLTVIISSSPIHSLCYNMFLGHYLTLISTAAHFTSATRVSGQITWSVADGRQMDPFPRNWLMCHCFMEVVLCDNKRMTVVFWHQHLIDLTYLVEVMSGNGFPGVIFWMSVQHMRCLICKSGDARTQRGCWYVSGEKKVTETYAGKHLKHSFWHTVQHIGVSQHFPNLNTYGHLLTCSPRLWLVVSLVTGHGNKWCLYHNLDDC